jgi:C4-dicarboxylate-specific signal transduction histidine kinase
VRGGEITKRLRSFVRRAETQFEQESVSSVVQESVGFVAGEARSSNVEIQSDLAENLPLMYFDRVQIQQVLVNLIKNAIEALQNHDTTSRRIDVSTRSVPAGVEVTVADNGPGLPADPTIDITEPFFTTKNNGVGLGLAISNTIIEAHKSRLFCEQNEFGGATFHFTLGNAKNRFQSTDAGEPELAKK